MPSMFIAPRDAKCSRPRRSFDGHELFSHRQTASSSGFLQLAAADRARRRHHPRLGTIGGSGIRRSDDARDHVAGLLDDHGLAGANVLADDVVGVVQRRHRDGRSGDDGRLEHRERRGRAGPADVDLDAMQHRDFPLGGKLERGGPPRELRGVSELFAQRRIVQLDHDAVGLERERASSLAPLLAKRDHRVDAVALLPVRLDRQPPLREVLQHLSV